MSVDRVAEARVSVPPPARPEGWLVYKFELDLSVPFSVSEAQLLNDFLARHEVALPGKHAFLDGAVIEIFRQEDGSFDVYVWRAVDGDVGMAPLCPSCPSCVKQQRWRVPLQGSAPVLRDVMLWGDDLPLDVPEDDGTAVGSDGLAVGWQRIEQADGPSVVPEPEVMVWVYDDLACEVTLGFAREGGMRLWWGSVENRITHWAPIVVPARPDANADG